MNKMKMKKAAHKLAQNGRNGDSTLVHMRPDEIQGLGLLGEATGHPMTVNPKTGYPEAWSLPSWVLPAAAIAATVFTGGAAAPAIAGAEAAAAGGAAAGGGLLAAEGAGAVGAGALGAGAAGTAGAGAAGAVGSGLTAAETAATAQAAGEAGSGGLLASQAAAPVTDLTAGQSVGLLDKANYATGNAFSRGGLLGKTGEYIDTANKVAKPVGQAMQVGQMFQKPPEAPMPLPPVPNITSQAPGQGAQTLNNIVSQGDQFGQQQQQQNFNQRQKRNQMIANIGRGY